MRKHSAATGLPSELLEAPVNKALTSVVLLDAPSGSSSCSSASPGSEWLPTDDPDSGDDQNSSGGSDKNYTEHAELHKEPKYIVFESSLKKLIQWCSCPECGSREVTHKWTTAGTQLSIAFICKACYLTTKWSSQPKIGNFPAGNILLSAGTLFSGASAGKVLHALNSIGVVTHDRRIFFRHQKLILHPAILRLWEKQQKATLTLLQVLGNPVVLGGDGRAVSP